MFVDVSRRDFRLVFISFLLVIATEKAEPVIYSNTSEAVEVTPSILESYLTEPDCIKTLTSPSGNISSPGFPWLYHPHVYCDWIVTVAKGQRVTVQVLTFDIPPMVGERCIYGYLEYGWFSSENNRMVEVGHRCGHQDLQKFTSPDNRCWIHFVGGSSYPHNFSQSGFFLKFETTIETESPISSAEETGTDKKLFMLFLLLFLVPIGLCACVYCRNKTKNRSTRRRDYELACNRFQKKHFPQSTKRMKRSKTRKIKIEVSPPSDDSINHHLGRRHLHTRPSGDYDSIPSEGEDFCVYRVMKNGKNYHRCSEVSTGSVFLNDSLMKPNQNYMYPQMSNTRHSRGSVGNMLTIPKSGVSSRCASYMTLSGSLEPDPRDSSHLHPKRHSRSSHSDRDPPTSAGISHLYASIHKPNTRKRRHHQSLPHPHLLEFEGSRSSAVEVYDCTGCPAHDPARPLARPGKIAKSLPFLYDFVLNGKSYVQKGSTRRKESCHGNRSSTNSQQYSSEQQNRSWYPSESDVAEYCTAQEDSFFTERIADHTSEGEQSGQNKWICGKAGGQPAVNMTGTRTPQTAVNTTGTRTPQTAVKVQNFSVSHMFTTEDLGSKKALFTSLYKNESLLSTECDGEFETTQNQMPQDYPSRYSNNSKHLSQKSLDAANVTHALMANRNDQHPQLVADYDNTTFEVSVGEAPPPLSLPPHDHMGSIEMMDSKASQIDPNNNVEGKNYMVRKDCKPVCDSTLVLAEGESMV